MKNGKVNLGVIFMLVCVLYTLTGATGYSKGSFLGRSLRGAPILVGDFLGVLWLLASPRVAISRGSRGIVFVAILMLLVGGLTFPVGWLTIGTIYPLYILGDVAWVLWLCLTLIAFAAIRHESAVSFGKMWCLYKMLAGVMFLCWLGGTLHQGLREAPNVVFFSVSLSCLAASVITGRTCSTNVLAYLGVCLSCLVLALLGWSRSIFLGFALAFLAWTFTTVRARSLKPVVALGILGTLVVALPVLHLEQTFTQSRFFATVRSGEAIEGASVVNRFLEADSATKTLKLTQGAILTGLGHGAVYVPSRELLRRTHNLTDEGFIHNIHVGPSLLLFRYGVLGVIFYFFLWFVVFKGLSFGRRMNKAMLDSQLPRTDRLYTKVKVFYAGYFIYLSLLVCSHFGNHFVNPFFAFSLATTLMFVGTPSLLSMPSEGCRRWFVLRMNDKPC